MESEIEKYNPFANKEEAIAAANESVDDLSFRSVESDKTFDPDQSLGSKVSIVGDEEQFNSDE